MWRNAYIRSHATNIMRQTTAKFTQRGTCYMQPFWSLEFGDRFQIFWGNLWNLAYDYFKILTPGNQVTEGMRLGISDLWQYILCCWSYSCFWSLDVMIVGCFADLSDEHAPRRLPKRRVQDETAVSNRHFISVSGAPILTGQGKNCLTPSHGYAFDPAYGGITVSRTVSYIAHFYAVHKQQNKITKNNESPWAWKSTSFSVCNRVCSQVYMWNR